MVLVCVALPLGKADQLAIGVFNHETEPTTVRRLECLSPLIFADLVAWPVPEDGRVRLVERRYVETGQVGDVSRGCLPDDSSLHVVTLLRPPVRPTSRRCEP